MKNYVIQRNPTRIPTQDNKIIDEHFGGASTQHTAFSVAHMVAPPQWSEPFQNPEFDELTLMVSGQKQIEVDGETLVLQAGESILIKKGARVRYSNPFAEPANYWSVCMPAFSLDTVHREEQG